MLHWHSPAWLWALWLLPAAAGLLLLARRWQRRSAQRLLSPRMLGRLTPAPGSARVTLRSVLVLLALGSVVVSLAGPQFGAYVQETHRTGADVFVVLDVSRSMLAEDVAPNRLARARSDVLDLVSRLEGDRVGLIVFAGTPVVRVPLTTDLEFFRTMLRDVDPATTPRGGSRIGDALRKALDSMEPRFDRDQMIVLISDGGDHESTPEEAARQAAERQVRVLTIGLGDPSDGARIPVTDPFGNRGYQQHEGQEVWSVLDEGLLERVARETGGAYVPARTRVYDLGEIYEDHLEGLARSSGETLRRRRYHERFQIFAALAFVCLIVEAWIPATGQMTPLGSAEQANG